jgi:hypothetical protein
MGFSTTPGSLARISRSRLAMSTSYATTTVSGASARHRKLILLPLGNLHISAAHRPEIRYVVLNVVKAAPVVNGILADQRRAMAAV